MASLPLDVIPTWTRNGEMAHGPNERLMLAVLQDALATFERGLRASKASQRQAFYEVDRWVNSEDTDWPFAFENVCARLGIDPGYIRAGLQRLKTQAFQRGGERRSKLPARSLPRRSWAHRSIAGTGIKEGH
jgi:hypothetical protein